MTGRYGFLGSDCEHGDEAGAYVLRALSERERAVFAEHLDTCADCRAEVDELQVVADQLPMAAPQLVPPPDIRNRLMAIVESEAELLRAAGPEADLVTPRRAAPTRLRDRVWWPSWLVSPGIAATAASVFVLAGVGAGVLLSGEDGPGPVRTVSAQVASVPGAKAHVALQDGRATLHVRGLPAASAGKVYQVWLKRGEADPTPTHTLFTVRPDGRAAVKVDEAVTGVDQLLVTAEPSGGSMAPTSQPVVTATLT